MNEMMNTAKKLLNGQDDLTNDNVKQILVSMMKIIEDQSSEIKTLKDELLSCKEKTVENKNDIHDLAIRTLELERYSRKTCLVFSNVEAYPDATTTVLSIMNNVLQIGIKESDIVTCHPLRTGNVLHVVVKFLYHKHRDLVWRRKSWLAGIKNSINRPVMIEELLAPHDREIKRAAMEHKIPTTTRRQRVFALNKNVPNSEAVEVKTVSELIPFKSNPQTRPSEYQPMFNLPHTPMPFLTRKPPTPGLSVHQPNKRSLQYSPISEETVNDERRQANKVQCSQPISNDSAFHVEETIDQT